MPGKPPKSFTERLRDRASTTTAKAGLANKAAILAARADIEAALAERWSVRDIWEQLREEGRIACGYVWFAKHVRDLIRAPSAPAASSEAGTSTKPPEPIAPPVEAAADPPAPDPTPPARERPTRFQHPESPNKDDYV